MATISALKKEIAGAGYFNAEQKKWLLNGIDKALNNMTVIAAAAPRKPRAVKTGSPLVTLQQWEDARKKSLTVGDLSAWMKLDGLSLSAMRDVVQEFRNEMIAKGKQYSNFAAACATYFRKGYLSKKPDQCRAHEGTNIETRGISL